jgi:hypothetical protein
MWTVLLALRRPLTFIVASLLLLLATPFVLLRTPTDIFPAGLLIIGLLCNLAVRPVAARYHYRGKGASPDRPVSGHAEFEPAHTAHH